MDEEDLSVPIPAEPDPAFRSGLPESGTLVADVGTAADVLGIGESAVLKRLKTGRLDGRKVGGRWQVFLSDSVSAGTERTSGPEFRAPERNPDAGRNAGTDRIPAVSGSARGQLAVLVEEMMAPIVARHGAEMRAAGETIGRLRADLDHERADRERAEAEAARLRAEVEQLRAAQDAPAAHDVAPGRAEPAGAASAPARSWWQRLLRIDG